MAKFCEGCPNRGECAGDIESMQVVSSYTMGSIAADARSASFTVESGDPIGPTQATVVYKDSLGGASEAITAYGNSGSDARNDGLKHVDRIGECTNPTIKKFLGLVVKRECSAGPS